jgi:hypothetical protein
MTGAGAGRVLLFGVVFLPVYLMLAGWVFGRPRELRLPLIGVGFLAGFTALAWGSMALFAWGVDVAFFR